MRDSRKKFGAAEVGAAVVIGFTLILAAVSGGIGSMLATAGLIGVLVGIYALIRGRSKVFRIRRRLVALGVAVAAFVALITGTGVYAAQHPNPDSTSAAATPSKKSAVPVSPIAHPSVSVSVSPNSTTTSASPAAGTALAVLAALPVKGKAPLTGYNRTADFGPAWHDVDHNGCDTRNDVLRRDLTSTSGTGCRVLTGTLHDPYTGKLINFVRGNNTSTAVQIDHVVSLADAWQTGAQSLSLQERVDLANDPINLFAVDGPTNEAKGDGDTATWLPPNKSFRCEYVAHQVAVKATYNLSVTTAERAAMARVLSACPTIAAPTSVTADLTPTVDMSSASAPAPKSVATTKPKSPHVTVYYANCSAVRAAGAAPLNRGAPGYRAGLDRDGDGVACELSSGSSSSSVSATSSGSTSGAPAGATARCTDGTYSWSVHRRGTCSHHGGVATWL